MFSAYAAALLALTVSITALRTGALPRWLAIAGIPAAALMLANAALPMSIITLWFVTVSIALTIRPTDHTTIPATAPAPPPPPTHPSHRPEPAPRAREIPPKAADGQASRMTVPSLTASGDTMSAAVRRSRIGSGSRLMDRNAPTRTGRRG